MQDADDDAYPGKGFHFINRECEELRVRADDLVGKRIVWNGVIVHFVKLVGSVLVGHGDLVARLFEIVEDSDVKESVAFIGQTFIGAPDEDAGFGGGDRGFNFTVGIGDEAEGGSCIHRLTEGDQRSEDAATGGALPVAALANDGVDFVELGFGFALGQHAQMSHHGDDALQAEADRRSVQTQGFAAFEQDHGLAGFRTGGAKRVPAHGGLEGDRRVEGFRQSHGLFVVCGDAGLGKVGAIDRAGVEVDNRVCPGDQSFGNDAGDARSERAR